MKQILSIILLLFSMLVNGQSSFNYQQDFEKILSRTKDDSDVLSFANLLSRFSKNDSTLTNFDVLALLIGYTHKPEYRPYQTMDIEKRIYKLNDERKFKEAISLADSFLITHPVNQKAINEKAYAYQNINESDSFQFYTSQYLRIINAMAFSGDGKTLQTAIFSLGPTDGQTFITRILGAKIGIMGSARDKAKNYIDVLQAQYKDGRSETFYFVIQHAVKKMFSN